MKQLVKFRAPALCAALPLLLSACGAGVPGSVNKHVAADSAPVQQGLWQYIQPLVGTLPPGFVNPGPVLPFGMVQPGPDTEGPLNYGGYSFNNVLITGFSHIHMSAGAFKGGEIPLMPLTGAPTSGDLAQFGFPGNAPFYASPYEHASEQAEAGYYRVQLLRYGVQAELTATERAGFHRYTYQVPGQTPRLLIAVGRDLRGAHPASATLRKDGVLTGRVQTDDQGGYAVYFAARFNAPFTAQVQDGGAALAEDQEVQADGLGVLLDFATLDGPLLAKVGISFVDADGALRNLDAEIPGWDFDAVRSSAQAKWDEALSRVFVEGGTEPEKQSFYTALSRAQQFPNLISDVDGRYPGPDDQIHTSARPHYSQYSLWDSYRGQNALLAEIVPGIYQDMVASLIDFDQQSGRLPRWQQAQRDAGHMSGDPAIPFIGEAWCRGLLDAPLRAASYDAMSRLAESRAEQIQLGYATVPKPGTFFEQIPGGERNAGTTLEYGLADFSLALMADSDGKAGDAQKLAQRSLNYRNLQDPETGRTQGFIRPRHDDGSWLTPFVPELPYGFQEGTSWQYSWLAMHDYAGLIEGMGGDDTVRQRLDTFFGFPLNAAPFVWPTIQNQITGFGVLYYGNQYAPGNEHDLEAPYVYNYIGVPWKTQATVRAAVSIYAPTPLGLPGNDDLGALSGALVWNMIGVYPINPGTPLYVIGSPHFERVTIRRPAGDFVVSASGASALKPYVDQAVLDGQTLARSWLILPRAAGTLDLRAVAVPDTAWGADAEARPPSLSRGALADFGCVP